MQTQSTLGEKRHGASTIFTLLAILTIETLAVICLLLAYAPQWM